MVGYLKKFKCSDSSRKKFLNNHYGDHMYKSMLVMSLVCLGTIAAHGEGKATAKPEAAMMSACAKEYPTQVKGKKTNDVAQWVETEERGANAETFKKSKCYIEHEKWEVSAGKTEENEHKM
jgi:hypothetical protein